MTIQIHAEVYSKDLNYISQQSFDYIQDIGFEEVKKYILQQEEAGKIVQVTLHPGDKTFERIYRTGLLPVNLLSEVPV